MRIEIDETDLSANKIVLLHIAVDLIGLKHASGLLRREGEINCGREAYISLYEKIHRGVMNALHTPD